MFVWIDLEMTGLNPRMHKIVEIATVITDRALTEVVEGPNLVIGSTEEELALMEPIVVEMHTTTGLLKKIKDSKVTMAQAEEQTLKFIAENVPDPSKVPLCGNSIGTDRRFLDTQMPRVEKALHYRTVDVTSLRLVCEQLRPKVAADWQKISDNDDSVKHRALDDIYASIAELRHYYKHWLEDD